VLALAERERGKLASTKLGVLSTPTGLQPMSYDVSVSERGKRGNMFKF
jgi:hypothetical protein